MNKITNALIAIKSSEDAYLKRAVRDAETDLACTLRNIEEYKNAKIRCLKNIEEAKKKAESSKAEIDTTKIQEEINKIYTLPIRDLKVVRTKSKTGYLPKILITTGIIKLADFVDTQTSNPSYFRQHVGKTLGRFIIQYDWSTKNSGKPITIMNLTYQAFHYQSACINTGTPCFGNIQTTVTELFRKKEFFKLTELILDYLENPLYGTPYYEWTDWFNHNKFSTADDIKYQLFYDYRGQINTTEWKTIEKMIPAKELAVLNRDKSKDFTYPTVYFNNNSTEENCHCDKCNQIRKNKYLFDKFIKENQTDLSKPVTDEELALIINPNNGL